MKHSLIKLLFVFSLFLGYACKKSKDNTAPFVNINSPVENQSFLVGESIPVRFDIADETRIDYAQLTVSDEDGIQVLSPVTFHDLENNQVVEHSLLIDNTGLASGVYFVSVLASDGDNKQSYFKKINIQALPLERKAIYFVEKSVAQYKVSKVDSSLSLSFAYSLVGDFIGAAIDSKNKRLLTCGGYTGKLLSTRIVDYSEAWSESPVGSTYPTYRSVSSVTSLNFISYNSGFIKGYDYAGVIKFNASSNAGIFYPLKNGISAKYVLSEQASFVGNSKKLVLYNFPVGSSKQETNFSGEVVELLPKSEDDFFIFYNQGNSGKISLYSASGNGISYTYPFPLSGKIISAEQITNSIYLVGTENGIYKFTYNPQNYVLFKASIAAAKLKFDVASNQVIASQSNKLYIYDNVSGQLLNTITSSDSIVDFQLFYNR